MFARSVHLEPKSAARAVSEGGLFCKCAAAEKHFQTHDVCNSSAAAGLSRASPTATSLYLHVCLPLRKDILMPGCHTERQ